MSATGKISRLPRSIADLRAILNALDVESLNREVLGEARARVAIIGVVNSGKSTLLNFLTGKAASRVSAMPGTTRANVESAVGPFLLVDTPGFGSQAQPDAAAIAQRAIDASSANLMLLDAAAGVREADLRLFEQLGRRPQPLVVALNKMDLFAGKAEAVTASAEARLGRSVIPISARTGMNVAERLVPRLIDEHMPLAVALGRALPHYRRMAAEQVIRKAATLSMLAGFEPVPGIDVPVLLLAQVRLVLRIAALYGEEITSRAARELIATMAGGVAVRYLGEQAGKFLPGPGWAISAGFAAAGTYAIGQVARDYFESGKRLPIADLRARYARAVQERRQQKGTKQKAQGRKQ